MDEYDIQNFSDVWSRVMPGAAGTDSYPASAVEANNSTVACGTSVDDAQTLYGFIADEMSDSRYYAVMAARCRKSSAVFRRLSAEEAGHAKKLCAAYFILTGECCIPEPESVHITSLSDALRALYIGETKSAAAYTAAAEASGNERLADLYICLAADEARHAGIIEELIEQLMC